MEREKPNSGEIFNPKTVKNSFTCKAQSTCHIPVIFDCLERKVIVFDFNIKTYARGSNVFNSENRINYVRAFVNASYPTLYEIFKAQAEGKKKKIVDSAEKADIVFNVDDAYKINEISRKYL